MTQIKQIISISNAQLTFHLRTDNTIKAMFSDLLGIKKNPKKIEHNVLKKISLNLYEGERLGIIGNNGSGKSSLLKAICGIYPLTSGSIHANGNIAPLLELGAGFQPEFTGRENIYLNGTILGMKPSFIRKIEKEIIDFSGIGEAIDKPVKTYSSGMYIRLAFSIATSSTADIIILDEVLAAGDKNFFIKAQNRMKELIGNSKLLVLVSHDLNQIREFCNRAIWIDNGAIVIDGEPDLVIDSYINKGLKGTKIVQL